MRAKKKSPAFRQGLFIPRYMAYKGSHAKGELPSMQSRREATTGRTMTVGVNLYPDAHKTPQNATGAVKQEGTKE